MSQRNESIREALQDLLEGQVVTQVEKTVGMARGSLTRKVTGDRATRIDDVILVGEALGIDPIDIGQHMVDGVDVQRGVLDRANWRIAAYCPQMVGNTVIAGVIKEEEFRVITAAAQGTPIAENSLTYLLDCPGE